MPWLEIQNKTKDKVLDEPRISEVLSTDQTRKILKQCGTTISFLEQTLKKVFRLMYLNQHRFLGEVQPAAQTLALVHFTKVAASPL